MVRYCSICADLRRQAFAAYLRRIRLTGADPAAWRRAGFHWALASTEDVILGHDHACEAVLAVLAKFYRPSPFPSSSTQPPSIVVRKQRLQALKNGKENRNRRWAWQGQSPRLSRPYIENDAPEVSLRLARLLATTHEVTSIIRNPAQAPDIEAINAIPHVLSLADAPVGDFTAVFTGTDVVYFSAGAGGAGGEELTKKIDYEGAVKVFDALEGVQGAKPLLILVSAIDVRDPEKIPAHYVRIVTNDLRRTH